MSEKSDILNLKLLISVENMNNIYIYNFLQHSEITLQ